jgi:hypothetical protein
MTGEGASSLKALVAKKPPLPSNFADIIAADTALAAVLRDAILKDRSSG